MTYGRFQRVIACFTKCFTPDRDRVSRAEERLPGLNRRIHTSNLVAEPLDAGSALESQDVSRLVGFRPIVPELTRRGITIPF